MFLWSSVLSGSPIPLTQLNTETVLRSLATDGAAVTDASSQAPPGAVSCRILLASQLVLFLVTESSFQLFVLLFNTPSYFFPLAHFRLASPTKIVIFPERTRCDIMFTVKQCSRISMVKTDHKGYVYPLWLTLLQVRIVTQGVELNSSIWDKVMGITRFFFQNGMKLQSAFWDIVSKRVPGQTCY